MSSAVNLYAEFLLNIRQVTLYATLQSEGGVDSTAHVFSDQKSITVTCEGQTSTIIYPSGISGKATVHFPISGRKVISLRFETVEDGVPLGNDMEVSNDSPWPSWCLGEDTEIACGSCRSIVLRPGTRVWRDLPRSNWAEMMDFWHCHKPKKGTFDQAKSTNSTLGRNFDPPMLSAGIVFVDACHIIAPQDECSRLRIEQDDVICLTCSRKLGITDTELQGIKFFKWSLLVKPNARDAWERNKLQNFICAQLLQIIDSQAVRKFFVYSGDLNNPVDAIYLWVFNADFKYSASCINDGRPRRAMKILYNVLEDFTKMQHNESHSVEEVKLPQPIASQLRQDLELSNGLIPERARLIQGWKVGLLDRFEPENGRVMR